MARMLFNPIGIIGIIQLAKKLHKIEDNKLMTIQLTKPM
jgi:hypothetical protein